MTNIHELALPEKKSGASSLLRKVFLTLVALMVAIPGFAQTLTVTGTVTDESGEPLIGVTVKVDGTTIGTATDLDGNYRLNNVPAKGKLSFSYVGYQPQTINVMGQPRIDAMLSDSEQTLNDLVVIGYGTVKKSDLTGSISSIDTEALNAKGASTILENLQGSIPGVNISKASGRANGDIEIEIRGKSSIQGDTKPIYVVDGIITKDINFLNPQDIEQIDVLKDASSTAIYGSRATAGVVIITTKSGTNVNKSIKAQVSYDGYYGISKVARMPDFMDGNQWYQYRFLKFLSPVGGDNNWQPQTPFQMLPQSNGVGQALIQQLDNDLTSPYILKQMLADGATTDWPDLVTGNGHQQNHFVSVSGASETASYHFGLGYNDEKGIYEGDGKTTYSFKGSVDAKITSWFSAGINFNLSKINNSYASDDAISQAYRVNPFMIPYTEDGEIQHFPGNKATLGTNGNQFSDFINPMDRMRNESHKRKSFRALGNIYAQFTIIPGLVFKSTFMPDYENYRDGVYVGYTNPKTGQTYVDNDVRYAQVINNTEYGWTWDNMLTFDRTFGEHGINIMALYSAEKAQGSNYQWRSSGVVEGSDWWNMGSGEYDAKESKSSYKMHSLQSWALRANYNLMGRYLLTATIRWDGSSRFREGNKWGSFPSVAAAWRISEEKFMQMTWLSNLKLRLSYGLTGNNSVKDYATIVGIKGPVYYPFGSNLSQGFYPSGVVDPDIKWEKSHEFDAGIDFGFLNDRISGSIDFYNKKSYDLLFEVDLPFIAGGGKMTTNIGSVRNTGVEIALTTRNIQTRSWNWTTSFMFSHNYNKVLQLNGVSDRLVNGIEKSLFLNHPVNNAYGYAFDGIISDRMMTVPDNDIARRSGFTPGDQVKEYDYYYKAYGLTEGQPIVRDVNGDGKWDDADKVIYNTNPKWQGSITSTLSYTAPKNGGIIDFSFSIFTKQGQKVYSPFMNGDYFDYHDRGRGKMAMDYYIPAGTLVDVGGVNPDGTFINPVYQTQTHYGDYPFPNSGFGDGLGIVNAYYKEAHSFVDASYVKVQNISLGYTFAKGILDKFGCKNLRLYINITNPFVWTKYKGFDPEWAQAAGKNDGPSIVGYQFGANITF